nr:hypothetical protein [uncultured Marinifilum sp.]
MFALQAKKQITIYYSVQLLSTLWIFDFGFSTFDLRPSTFDFHPFTFTPLHLFTFKLFHLYPSSSAGPNTSGFTFSSQEPSAFNLAKLCDDLPWELSIAQYSAFRHFGFWIFDLRPSTFDLRPLTFTLSPLHL